MRVSFSPLPLVNVVWTVLVLGLQIEGKRYWLFFAGSVSGWAWSYSFRYALM